ncbi:MAG TPA: DNA repair protein RecN, partial [Planctomycetota bacterium]|nr:DNA repair protein RecN [Planctomycetota bacterium]
MLEQLTIRGLALLDVVTLSPSRHLTVISGETGGGKSLVIAALRLLRGEKAKAGIVRSGAAAASVDGVFALVDGERSTLVRELYEEVLGTELDEDRLVVSRIVDAKGKSRARIDGRPVPLRELQRFGALLIEIHGQGENRSLMRPEIQTELVDAFAGTTELRRRFARELVTLREVAAELARARAQQRERRERVEWLRHCLGDFERLDPRPGERAELERQVKIFGSLSRMRDSLGRGL